MDENLVTQIQYLRDSIINNVITTSTETGALNDALIVSEPKLENITDDTDENIETQLIVPDK